MPNALRPDRRLTLWLASDEDLPQAKRPTFVFKHLSGADWEYMMNLGDRLKVLQGKKNADAYKDGMNEIYGALGRAAVGWTHMVDPDTEKPIPFEAPTFDEAERLVTAGSLKHVLDLNEALELTTKLCNSIRLGVDDRKKSASQSKRRAGRSVQSVGPGTVRTRRQKPNRRR
jgi:hypothetical protein